MSEKQMPELLTPEIVKTMAENAEALKGIISSNDESAALRGRKGGGCGGDVECCCPELVKFKFVLCNVWIDVNNAACPSHNPC